MPQRRSEIALALALGLAANVSVAGVSVRYDETVDFSAFSTYAWKEGTPARRAGARERIALAVDRALDAWGLQRVEQDPDLWVVTHVLVDRQSLEQLADSDYWEFVTGNTSVDAYDVGAGTLVVDLVDARSRRLVWRGLADANVSGSVEKIARKIDKIVAKLFRRYPGSSGVRMRR